ncbi:MAG: HTTM domain-containing protein [Cyanobacteria bacterium J06623_7]
MNNSFLYRWISRTIDSRPLGVARIGIGLAFLIDWLNKLERRYASLDPNSFHYPWWSGLPVLPPELANLPFVLWLIGGLGIVWGFKTRSSGIIALVGNGLYFFSDRQNYSNHGYLLLLLIFLLILADSGAAISWDARQRQRRQIPGWGVDLLKIQLSVVYFFTFMVKIRPDWLSGSLMYLNLNGPFATYLTQLPGVYRGLAWFALLTEGFLFWGLWSKKWRALALLVGVLLHVGILLTVKFTLGLISFGLLSLSLYPLFLELPAQKVTVSLRPDLGLFTYLLNRLKYFDWLGATELKKQESTSMQRPWLLLQESNGRERINYDGLSRWLSLLPALAPFAVTCQFLGTRGNHD